MEECVFFQDIIDLVENVQIYVDSCLQEPSLGNVDKIESRRRLIKDTTQKIKSIVVEKDKGYQILYERNKVLEARMKTITHLLRAMDKMTQIPEVPIMLKEENVTLAEMTTVEAQEESQLSVIPEITEPDNSNIVKHNKSNHEQETSSEDMSTPSKQMRITGKESPSPKEIAHPPPLKIVNNFETSTPKPTGETKHKAESTRHKFFPKPKLESLFKSDDKTCPKDAKVKGKQSSRVFENMEDEVRKLVAKHINQTISIKDDSIYSDISSEEENYDLSPTLSKKQSGTSSIQMMQPVEFNQTGSKFKLKEPILDVDKLLNAGKLKQSTVEVQKRLQSVPLRSEKVTERQNVEGITRECEGNIEEVDVNAEEEKERAKNVFTALNDSDEDVCEVSNEYEQYAHERDNEEKEGADEESENEPESSDAMCGVPELIDLTTEVTEETVQGRRPIRLNEETQDGVRTNEICEKVGNAKEKNKTRRFESDEEIDTEDDVQITQVVTEIIPRRRHAFWKSKGLQNEATHDEDIEVTATHVQINEEDLQNATQEDNAELEKELGDIQGKNNIHQKDEDMIKQNESSHEIQEQDNQNVSTKLDESDSKVDRTQMVDLITINNYNSSSMNETNVSGNSDENISNENNIHINKMTDNMKNDISDDTKNVNNALRKVETNSEGSKHDTIVLKDCRTNVEEFKVDDTQYAETEEVAASSTYLSLTNKTMVNKVGDNVNIVFNPFLNNKKEVMRHKDMKFQEGKAVTINTDVCTQEGKENIERNDNDERKGGETSKTATGSRDAITDKRKETIGNLTKVQEEMTFVAVNTKLNNQTNEENTIHEQEKKMEDITQVNSTNRTERKHLKTDTSDSDDKTEMVVEIEEKQYDETLEKNDHETKIQGVKDTKKGKSGEKTAILDKAIDKNMEKATPSIKENFQPRRTLRERRKKIFPDSSDTEDDEHTKKRPKTVRAKSKINQKQKEENDMSEDEQPMKKRAVPKRNCSKTRIVMKKK